MRAGTASALALLAVLFLSGCNSYETEWRQKMTVTVETPSGPVSGSSVVGVSFERGNEELMRVTEGSGVKWSISGEAVAVDLGQGRFLFALLKGMNFRGDAGPNASFVFSGLKGVSAGEVAAIEQVLADRSMAPTPVPRDAYPLLVTFGDINDPKSVRRVDPDDLAASFGPGYRLKQITLEITDDPVTEGRVEQVLGWLRDGTTLKKIWGELTSQQRDQLSSTNWKR